MRIKMLPWVEIMACLVRPKRNKDKQLQIKNVKKETLQRQFHLLSTVSESNLKQGEP